MDPLVGRILLERYEVLRKVGSGGMGAVYVARQLAVGREVAVKVLRPELLSSELVRERFRREAAIIGRLRHPSTIQLIDYGETEDGFAVMAMELLIGLSLADRLKQEGPLPVRDAVEVCRQVASSLEEAHALGLVHRDLKPANVMVGNLGGVRVAKVSDFGLVRVLDQAAATRLTVGDAPMGTPGYIAPEQALSGRVADTRSDIFSLGCILYRCLCGRPPFSKDLREGWESLSRGLYTPPLELVPELEPRLVSAIVACLRVDPEQRPPDVAALRRILARPRAPRAGGVGAPPELAALAGLVSDAVPPPVPTHLQSVQPGVAPPSAVAAAPVVATPSRPTAPAARGSSAPALLGAAAFVLVAGAILALGALWTVLG